MNQRQQDDFACAFRESGQTHFASYEDAHSVMQTLARKMRVLADRAEGEGSSVMADKLHNVSDMAVFIAAGAQAAAFDKIPFDKNNPEKALLHVMPAGGILSGFTHWMDGQLKPGSLSEAFSRSFKALGEHGYRPSEAAIHAVVLRANILC